MFLTAMTVSIKDYSRKQWDPLFNLPDLNSRNGVKLGKHAYGSYLLNENPAAEGGGKSQRRESLTVCNSVG